MPRAALVVIDMLNRYEHEDAAALIESVREVVPQMGALVKRAEQRDAPIVYVNDNYGDWRAGPDELCERALAGPDRALVEPVLPPPRAAFVTKARHSIFYETSLEYLLRREEIDHVVLSGQVTEQCVLYSALDAYVRHLGVSVASDAVAHIHPQLADAALQMMERNMRARVVPAQAMFAE
jgi:nicotinamidase-related amidase